MTLMQTTLLDDIHLQDGCVTVAVLTLKSNFIIHDNHNKKTCTLHIFTMSAKERNGGNNPANSCCCVVINPKYVFLF